jgi:hypothetical protein
VLGTPLAGEDCDAKGRYNRHQGRIPTRW